MSRTVERLCRIRFIPKNEDTFRLKSRDLGTVSYVAADRFVIGGAKDADVIFSGTGVADHHLMVKVKGLEMWLEDLGSSSGTIVSGNSVPPHTPFPYRPGEVIQIGQSDHVLTIDVFGRMWRPDEEAEAIVQEARERVEQTEHQRQAVLNEIQQELEQSQAEKAAIENGARIEAERLLTEARRQIEEKTRLAIEEGHARTEVLQKQAALEAEKNLRQAQEAANDLIGSAKKEVEHLLSEARGKADAIAHEGIERKQAALAAVDGLNAEITRLSEEKKQFETETLQSKMVFDEAFRRKDNLLRQVDEIESEHAQAQSRLETLRAEAEKIKNECREFEARTAESRRLQQESEKYRDQLNEESQRIQTQIGDLSRTRDTLLKEIDDAQERKTRQLEEINQLEEHHRSELRKIRQKVDDEYARQCKEQMNFFQALREREELEQADFQRRLDQYEEKRLSHQTHLIHERIWNLISDRSILFGIVNLRDNTDFKGDLERIISQALGEEFEFRRRESLNARPLAKKAWRRQRFMNQTTRYAGWLVSSCLLGIFLSLQFAPDQRVDREPASQPPVFEQCRGGSVPSSNSPSSGAPSGASSGKMIESDEF